MLADDLTTGQCMDGTKRPLERNALNSGVWCYGCWNRSAIQKVWAMPANRVVICFPTMY